jgi:hypothetical protein
MLTGWVACQKVPVTATEPVIVVEARVTGIADWSEAKTTGVDAAIAFCPWVLMRPVKVALVKRVERATSRLALVTATEPVMVVEVSETG